MSNKRQGSGSSGNKGRGPKNPETERLDAPTPAPPHTQSLSDFSPDNSPQEPDAPAPLPPKPALGGWTRPLLAAGLGLVLVLMAGLALGAYWTPHRESFVEANAFRETAKAVTDEAERFLKDAPGSNSDPDVSSAAAERAAKKQRISTTVTGMNGKAEGLKRSVAKRPWVEEAIEHARKAGATAGLAVVTPDVKTALSQLAIAKQHLGNADRALGIAASEEQQKDAAARAVGVTRALAGLSFLALLLLGLLLLVDNRERERHLRELAHEIRQDPEGLARQVGSLLDDKLRQMLQDSHSDMGREFEKRMAARAGGSAAETDGVFLRKSEMERELQSLISAETGSGSQVRDAVVGLWGRRYPNLTFLEEELEERRQHYGADPSRPLSQAVSQLAAWQHRAPTESDEVTRSEFEDLRNRLDRKWEAETPLSLVDSQGVQVQFTLQQTIYELCRNLAEAAKGTVKEEALHNGLRQLNDHLRGWWTQEVNRITTEQDRKTQAETLGMIEQVKDEMQRLLEDQRGAVSEELGAAVESARQARAAAAQAKEDAAAAVERTEAIHAEALLELVGTFVQLLEQQQLLLREEEERVRLSMYARSFGGLIHQLRGAALREEAERLARESEDPRIVRGWVNDLDRIAEKIACELQELRLVLGKEHREVLVRRSQELREWRQEVSELASVLGRAPGPEPAEAIRGALARIRESASSWTEEAREALETLGRQREAIRDHGLRLYDPLDRAFRGARSPSSLPQTRRRWHRLNERLIGICREAGLEVYEPREGDRLNDQEQKVQAFSTDRGEENVIAAVMSPGLRVDDAVTKAEVVVYR